MTTTLGDLINIHLTNVAVRMEKESLNILETGSIRSPEIRFRDGDGWSTFTLATHAKMHGGSAVSIDLDTRVAADVLAGYGLDKHIQLVTGHSIDVLTGYLAEGKTFDFILLDSDNDADLILHEYFIALRLIRDGGIIMIDDVEPGSREVLKGNALIPHLKQVMKPYTLHKRSKNAISTGVAVVEF